MLVVSLNVTSLQPHSFIIILCWVGWVSHSVTLSWCLVLTVNTLITAQTPKLGNGNVHGHGCFSLGTLPPTSMLWKFPQKSWYGIYDYHNALLVFSLSHSDSQFNSNPKRTSRTIRYLSFLFFGFIHFLFFMFLEWLDLYDNGVLDVNQQVLMNQKPEEIYWIMLATSLPIW